MHTPGSAPTAPPDRWIALAFLTFSALTSVIDNAVMTVVTPTLEHSFQASLEAVEWATSGYALVFGATMLLWGKLGAMFGHRRLFILGNLTFALGSALVGWSPTIDLLIAMRALQGLGAAMLNPAAIALIALLFTERERAVAYGINGMTGTVGVGLGYILGGLCAEYVGWRWAFYVNLPICILAAWGAWRYVPVTREHAERRPLDYMGAGQSLVGLALIIFALIQGQSLGWSTVKQPLVLFGWAAPLPVSAAPLALGLGCLLLAVFARRELALVRRRREPLFEVTLFRYASFRWGGMVGMLRFLAQFAVNYSVTLFLQSFEGIKALQAGLVSVPVALFGTMAAPLGGWLANRLGVQRIVLGGLLLQGAGMSWLWWLVAPALSLWEIAGPFSLFGLGSGLAAAQLNTATLQDVPRDRTGDASSAAVTLRQLGAPFAAALVGLILESTVTRLAVEGYDRSTRGVAAMENVVLAMMLINIVCLVLTWLIPNRVPSRGAKSESLNSGSAGE
jgi:EmrB/QacA subfamily drug resistance transporter